MNAPRMGSVTPPTDLQSASIEGPVRLSPEDAQLLIQAIAEIERLEANAADADDAAASD